MTSFLTTLYDDYTRSEVQGKLKETFKKQYKLTTWVEVQTRYLTVWVMTPTGIPVPTQVPYEYRIFHTKLVNKGLEVVIREELNNDQWKRYEIFQDTLGGRPYLFNGGLPPGGSDGSGSPGIDYQVPAEALTDSEFAAIYKEAQKYVGTPYVWGGSTPETGFDCSGYVCWVYNQNGYDVGRTTANGLWNKSQHISEAEAKPGDLVFFEGTYDTPGKSHVGIYLGNGMMVSAGDPIKYANIHSSYWEKYLVRVRTAFKMIGGIIMSEKSDKLRAMSGKREGTPHQTEQSYRDSGAAHSGGGFRRGQRDGADCKGHAGTACRPAAAVSHHHPEPGCAVRSRCYVQQGGRFG